MLLGSLRVAKHFLVDMACCAAEGELKRAQSLFGSQHRASSRDALRSAAGHCVVVCPTSTQELLLAGSVGVCALPSCATSSGSHHTHLPTLPTWSTISVTLKVYPGRHGLHVWRAHVHASAEPGR